MSTDTPSGGHDQAPRGDHPHPAEHAAGQQQADIGHTRQPAETRTRAEHNAARHAGPPIQRNDTSGRTTPADPPVPPPSNSNGAEARAGHGERAATADASTDRRHQPAEARTRAEYNEARHAGPPIQRNEHRAEAPAREESAKATRPGHPGAGPDATARDRQGHRTANPPGTAQPGHAPRPSNREGYDRETRAAENRSGNTGPGPAGNSERGGNGQDGDDGHLRSAGRPRHDSADRTLPGTQQQGTDTHRHETPAAGGTQASAHGNDTPGPVGGRRDQHPSASPADTGSGTVSGEKQAGADPDSEKSKHQPESDEPVKVYVDGREIEITGDPADGIWIQGLPGDAPDKTGDVLASPEKPEGTLGSKLYKKTIEVSNDLFDSLDKSVTLGSQIIERPPTQAEVPVSTHRHTPEVQYHAPEAGSLATGVLAAGIMLWASVRWADGRLRGAHHASDG